jgi:hypothetical protein
VVDMLANAAYLLGLTVALAPRARAWAAVFSFTWAEHGFYRAAQHGLAAELAWPLGRGRRLRPVRARDLVQRLLPLAEQGLLAAGVAPQEAARLLGVIHARAASGQTGAAWQRRVLADLEPRLGGRAAAAMLERYLERAATGAPVHTWPLAEPPSRLRPR